MFRGDGPERRRKLELPRTSDCFFVLPALFQVTLRQHSNRNECSIRPSKNSVAEACDASATPRDVNAMSRAGVSAR
jgi:hypothetical protein